MAKQGPPMIGIEPVLEGLRTSAGAFRWLDDYCASMLGFNREYRPNAPPHFCDYPMPEVARLSEINPELDKAILSGQPAAGAWKGGGFRPLRDDVILGVYGSIAEYSAHMAGSFAELARIEDEIRSAGGKSTKHQKTLVEVQTLSVQGWLKAISQRIAGADQSLSIFNIDLARTHDELVRHASAFPGRVDSFGDRLWQQMIKATGKSYGDNSLEQLVRKRYVQDLKDYWNEQLRLYVIPLNQGARSGISGLRTAWEALQGQIRWSVDQISLAGQDELGGVLQDLDIRESAEAWQNVAELATRLQSELS